MCASNSNHREIFASPESVLSIYSSNRDERSTYYILPPVAFPRRKWTEAKKKHKIYIDEAQKVPESKRRKTNAKWEQNKKKPKLRLRMRESRTDTPKTWRPHRDSWFGWRVCQSFEWFTAVCCAVCMFGLVCGSLWCFIKIQLHSGRREGWKYLMRYVLWFVK